jgi:hypothetical protein
MIKKFRDLPDEVFNVASRNFVGVLSKDGLVLRKVTATELTPKPESLISEGVRAIFEDLKIDILEDDNGGISKVSRKAQRT